MIRICINGAESVGKSTLAKELVSVCGGEYVAEYARTYVEELTCGYNYCDVVNIAKKQTEQLYATYNAPFVFFDTDLIITKVWFEKRYNKVPDFVEEYTDRSPIDYYLLLQPDLPFVADPTRENTDIREQLTERYLQLIKQTCKPYSIITGSGKDRLRNALTALTNAGIIKL